MTSDFFILRPPFNPSNPVSFLFSNAIQMADYGFDAGERVLK
jgi:hypothetical protein